MSVPRIRVDGFNKNFEKKIFGEIVRSVSTRMYIKSVVSDLGKYEVIQQGDRPILGYSDDQPFEKYKSVILFGDHTLSLYLPKAPFLLATDGIKILQSTILKRDYLYYLTQNYIPKSQGYKRHFSVLKQVIVNYSQDYSEQSVIGSLFRTLDDLLTSYKDNLTNYQSLKATMLSKMFPKAGQTVPEIRLDGFEDGWEEKEFSKLVKRVTQNSDSNSLPKVEFEDIISGQGRLNKDISNKFDNRKGIHFKPGYTLYGKLRPYLNNWLLPKFEGVALGDFWVFDPNGNDSNFIYYLVQSNRYQKVANDTSGTKMPRSDWKSVSSTTFAIPQTVAEQQAIGLYFSNIDKLIAAHQEKISQLETLKKKLLQDMFI